MGSGLYGQTTPAGSYAPVNTTMGRDVDHGYVCDDGGIPSGIVSPATWRFSEHCEFVQSAIVPAWYRYYDNIYSTGAIANDYALLTLRRDNHPNGLGFDRWMPISGINTDLGYEARIPVTFGYPGDDVSSLFVFNSWDRYLYYGMMPYGQTWRLHGADMYWTDGIVGAVTTASVLRTNIDAAQGQSGSPILYYSDNDIYFHGQPYFIIGLMTYMEDNKDSVTNFGPDWNGGPTAAQFKSNVIEWLAQ